MKPIRGRFSGSRRASKAARAVSGDVDPVRRRNRGTTRNEPRPRKGKTALDLPIGGHQTLRLFDVLRRIGVEEWIDRLGCPISMSDAVTGRPAVDFPHIFDNE